MKQEYIILIIFIIVIITLIGKFVFNYINRIRFIILDKNIYYIKNKKKKKICSIFDVTDIYIKSFSNQSTYYYLFFLKDKKTIFNLHTDNFYLRDVYLLYKKIKKSNKEIKYTEYNEDSFLNIFKYYKNKKLLKDDY